jgi:regulatory protein
LIEDILDTLSREGLQSDERFTESFVHHSLNKGQGPNKIKQELKQRGIDSSLIALCMESESIDWLSLAEEVRLKKYGETLPKDYQNKAKQSRFLYSRGFSSDVINQLLR